MLQPLIPIGGLAGYNLLKSTMPTQRAGFDQNPRMQRDTEYFAQTIGSITNAEDLVKDRRLMRVALGAFGLGDDLGSTAFIRKILEDGSEADDALANRLTDSRYREIAREFGFGDLLGARTGYPGFGDRIAEQFREREFERAVGDQDQAMRLALNAERALPDMVTEDTSETTKWLQILGNPPLRELFETALGLPDGFGAVDLDRQISELTDRSGRQLGLDSLADLAAPEQMDNLIRRFLLRDQVASFSIQQAGSAALTLLQSARQFNA